MKLEWTRAALADLQQILDFIAEDNPHAARALATGFRQTAEHLTQHPFIGRRGDLEGTREMILHRNYLLTYRVSSEAIEILQIWHVAQKRYH
ncbi:MAG: type II toxin-antitoxin system mRNA interferase toxin, RelE/StbE family [Betaproteobacteria bacterium HGW-Betaproteobacteria-17]|nr:MAG: type II toxin-antitoxin system mRNA interferase toxin, RelE/StbE family [Betaproteobacteria bacterium HGW-Betaproteobacteria-17]